MFFSWRIIDLQCHAVFCPTTKWRSMSLPSWTSLPPLTPSHPSLHPTSLGWHGPRAELPALQSKFPRAVLHTVVCMFPSYSQFIPPPPAPTVSTSVFCLRLHCCPAETSISTVSLDFVYVCLTYDWHLFFSNLLHCAKQALGSLFPYFRGSQS